MISKMKWIPCNEKLPKEADGKVLICTEDGEVNTGKHSEFSGQWYVGDMCGVSGSDVIAWMPLPEPSKGAKKKVKYVEKRPKPEFWWDDL